MLHRRFIGGEKIQRPERDPFTVHPVWHYPQPHPVELDFGVQHRQACSSEVNGRELNIISM